MKRNRSRLLMLAAAVLTALLLWFAPEDEGVSEAIKSGKPLPATAKPVASAVPRSPAAAPPAPAASAANLAVPTARPAVGQGAAGDLFAPSTWVVAPPPPPPPPPPGPPPPPPAPVAPPLPFTYLGKYSEGSLQLVILSRGNRVLTAAQGDLLETQYRVERIDPTQVLFTYLPLGTSQSLPAPP
jgi:hypothetical protein